MWVIKILSGAQAGHVFKISEGTRIIGREPGCDIIIASPGVSKQHAKIDILDSKIILTDLGSTNGTFVNGVKIQSMRINGSETLSLHDVMFKIENISNTQIIKLRSKVTPKQQVNHYHHPAVAQIPQFEGSSALNMQSELNYDHHQNISPPGIGNNQAPNPMPQNVNNLTFVDYIRKYIDEVVLPGVYKLPEHMEFKTVIAVFVAAFVLFVTSLSAIPLMRILKASIEKESQRRALTIARTLAKVNRGAIMQGIESSVSIEIATREPGVDKALIISSMDGHVIAPSTEAGQVPDLPFIHEARKEGQETVKQIDDNTIGALVPIEFYNPETGTQGVTAFAAVIYNMGTLAVDDSRTLSLFIQTFFIALIVGSILYFFMLKTIEFPIFSLNKQLDSALKDGADSLSVNYKYPALQKLISNINSSLSRMSIDTDSNNNNAIEYDRNSELNNIVQLIGFGAAAVSAHDHTFQALNTEFEAITSLRPSDVLYTSIESVNDQALRLSLIDLVERSKQNPYQLNTNELELAGENYELAIQPIYGSANIAYYVIVLLPSTEGGAHS